MWPRLQILWLIPILTLATGSWPVLALTTDQIAAIKAKIASSKIRPSVKRAHLPAAARRPIETAIVSARNLVGRVYDQKMGNDGGKNYAAGQIVCVDVPRLALLDGGVPMADLLLEDARLHPGRYPKERSGDNLPGHPIFARRTRNWLRWCQGNGRLLPPTAIPKPGDVIFYGDIHISFVTAVEPDGHYKVVECAPSTGLALEQYEWMVALRGWKPTGIGRILPLPASYASLARAPRTVVAKSPDPRYTIESQQKNHPGLALLTGVLNRLNRRQSPGRDITIALAPGKTGAAKVPIEVRDSLPARSSRPAPVIASLTVDQLLGAPAKAGKTRPIARPATRKKTDGKSKRAVLTSQKSKRAAKAAPSKAPVSKRPTLKVAKSVKPAPDKPLPASSPKSIASSKPATAAAVPATGAEAPVIAAKPRTIVKAGAKPAKKPKRPASRAQKSAPKAVRKARG